MVVADGLDERLFHAADGFQVGGDAGAERGVCVVLLLRGDVDAAGEAVTKSVECARIALFRYELFGLLQDFYAHIERNPSCLPIYQGDSRVSGSETRKWFVIFRKKVVRACDC